MLALIPLLFIALLISKVLPIAILKKWYDTKTVFAASMLLTSTLSLVIAAATIGERLEVITSEMHSALIMVAVLSCIITPPSFFKKYYENKEEVEYQQTVSFVGVNQATIPVLRELEPKDFETYLYHTKQDKLEENNNGTRSIFDIHHVDNYELNTLASAGGV